MKKSDQMWRVVISLTYAWNELMLLFFSEVNQKQTLSYTRIQAHKYCAYEYLISWQSAAIECKPINKYARTHTRAHTLTYFSHTHTHTQAYQ